MTAFLLAAFYALRQLGQGHSAWIYGTGVVLFLLLSSSQLYSHRDLIDMWLPDLLADWYAGDQARVWWTITPLVGWFALILSWRQLLKFAFFSVAVAIGLRNGWHIWETEYLFSGVVAYLTLFFILQHRRLPPNNGAASTAQSATH